MSSTPPDEQSLLGRLTNIFGGSSANLPKPDQDEEEGMARMSFLGHLEELCHRIILIVYGLAAAFHAFWNMGNDDPAKRIIAAQDAGLTGARLFLAGQIGQVVRNGLAILGVQAVEEL